MNKNEIILAILVSAVITFSLRALPFVAFRDGRKMPEELVYLGKILPSAIMAVLIVYCLKSAVTDWRGTGVPELIAAVVTVISYKWKHNTLFSIVSGTVCNMLLLRLMQRIVGGLKCCIFVANL